MSDLYYQTISELAPKLQKKELSPVELTDVIFSRIDKIDKQLTSYITVMKEKARKRAKQAEAEIMNGNYRGPLHGVPLALKDMLYTKGVITTAGSKVLEDFVPDFDATVVTKLQNKGAIITGKLNMHEFAFGTTNENPHYGDAKNPWDVTRITGGSSGGSGAAVAAGLCYAALGSDTGGSIRTPSALCGIVGLKPTFGRVSKYGSIPLAWSLDHIGPMARCVDDLAIVLEAIAGFDQNDPTTVQRDIPNYRSRLLDSIEGLKVGVPVNYFFDDLDQEVEKSVKTAIHKLEQLGAKTVEVAIPNLELAMFSELTTIRSEAIAYHHETLVEKPHLYGKDVRISLKVGELITAKEYIRAQQARRRIQEGFSHLFQQVDVIIAPALTMTAPERRESYKKINGEYKDIRAEILRMAAPANLTGVPSLAIPVGFSSENMPIAMQIMGKPFNEKTLLKVAAAYERASEMNRVPIA